MNKIHERPNLDHVLKREGVILLRDAIPKHFIKRLRDITLPILEKERFDKGEYKYVRNIHDITNEVSELSHWVSLESLLKTWFPTQMENMNIKRVLPGSIQMINAPKQMKAKQKWHRDTTYYAFSLIIPLVDMTVANGCTQILKNSQHMTITHATKALSEGNTANIVAKCGDLCIFDSRLVHRGTNNKSSEDRPIIIAPMSEYQMPFTATLS